MQWISYLFTRGFTELFRLVPFRVLYILSDGVAFLLYHVIRYRRKVVMDNLLRCFPEKSQKELNAISKASYINLSDIILESLKGTTTPLSTIRKRYIYKNYEAINAVLAQGRSVVLVGGHFNNWEWGAMTIASCFDGNSIGVYKPLSNKLTDQWLFKSRSRDEKMTLKSMKDTFRAVEEFKNEPTVVILVSDQVPSNRRTAIAVNFFGHRTACLPGTEMIAKSNNYPVFLYDIRRIKRGHYEFTMSEVCSDPLSKAPGEITQMYMSAFEKIIREDPSGWLWSHKRWKWQPE